MDLNVLIAQRRNVVEEGGGGVLEFHMSSRNNAPCPGKRGHPVRAATRAGVLWQQYEEQSTFHFHHLLVT